MNKIIAGVDEAGRGPLAGPVYAAVVILAENNIIHGIGDSKKIPEKKRNLLFDEIVNQARDYAIAKAEVWEIDSLNILQATLLAMKRAVAQLKIRPDEILIDGNQIPKIDGHFLVKGIIGGDASILEIGAASILAKVSRDREMLILDQEYPQYGFSKHKGYGTKEHLAALKKYGASPVHRQSFRPVREAISLFISRSSLEAQV